MQSLRRNYKGVLTLIAGKQILTCTNHMTDAVVNGFHCGKI